VPLKAIYSSPLERAVATAEAIAREMNLQVIKRDRLNEVNFGDWTGRTFQSLADDPLWNRFNTQRSTARVPGGDSMIETQIRIVSELNRLSANHVDDRVAVVTHADVIKAALAQFATIHLDFIKNIEISPGSVSVVTTDEYESRLLTTNNVADFSELLH
jgi:probable phosphoglycerate mutase